jgi:Tol biopolymer transport system component
VRSFALSPDGRQVLLQRLDPAAGTDDIWTLDLLSDRLVRLTRDPSNDTDPIWSPDGREVLFSSDRLTGQYDLFRRSADPGGQDTLFSSAPGSKFAEDWSADGETIALVRGNEGARRVSVVRVSQPDYVQDTPGETTGEMDEPAISPDSRLVAYHSSAPGVPEVFVVPMAASPRRWQVSPRGGVQPRWRADGHEIFYLALDGTVMAAPVVRRGAETFRVGTAHPVLATGVSPGALVNDYAVSRDGDRIVVRRQTGGQVTRLAVILDWHSPFD